MSGTLRILLALLMVPFGGEALAARLLMPTGAPVPYEAFTAAQNNGPWIAQREPVLVERPIGDVLAARMGVVQGKAELFHFRLENAPSQSTILKGFVDGGGIKLKVTW